MTKKAILGSVSWGTHLPEDLIPRFIDTLAQLDKAKADAFRAELPEDLEPNDPYWDSEEAYWLLEELFDTLDEFAPDGHYFGSHEGDGSDFGFWPVV